MDHPNPPTTSYEPLENLLVTRDADAFIHISDRFDDLLLYLTRFHGPDRTYAFVYADGCATLCAPRLFAEQAEREFSGDVVRAVADQSATNPPHRALEVLAEVDGTSEVLVPDSISISAYRNLQEGLDGAEIGTVESCTLGRPRKTPAEQACHANVQRAAQQGMARAEAILTEAERDGDDLRWQGARLTTESLRQQVNATLALHGVRDAGNTVIGAGETCADLHFTGTDIIRPHETVLLDISPRGPHGYYGDCTRTFVVGDVGDWETTAYEAVVAAQDAALTALEGGAGTSANAAQTAASRVLSDYGFEVGDVDVGMYHGVGHGVGLSLHEDPSLTSDTRLEPGNVVTVEPGIYDSTRGGVRIEDLIVITEDGYENLTEYPREITPTSRQTDWDAKSQ